MVEGEEGGREEGEGVEREGGGGEVWIMDELSCIGDTLCYDSVN